MRPFLLAALLLSCATAKRARYAVHCTGSPPQVVYCLPDGDSFICADENGELVKFPAGATCGVREI